MEELKEFFTVIDKSIEEDTFVKITLSKPARKSEGLQNVYVRLVMIKDITHLSFTYRYKTNDQVKNYEVKEAQSILNDLLNTSFKIATVFTLNEDYSLRISKKGKFSIVKTHPSFTNKPPVEHNRPKKKYAELGKYLNLLGITDDKGSVIPKMADKFRQINKYLEIVESLIDTNRLSKKIKIVDMGCGKGYLTFALYDYLVSQKKMDVSIIGVEMRQGLVDYCNQVAEKSGFDNLKFECNSIEAFKSDKIDILIALHACDTATDDAIAKGLVAKSDLIICAPCCHKQIRQQVKGKEQRNPILKYGIFKERQFEMITDTIRALLLEKHQYQTKIFEFISIEHTGKNVMLVGIKSSKKNDEAMVSQKIIDLKNEYGIEEHYLETLV